MVTDTHTHTKKEEETNKQDFAKKGATPQKEVDLKECFPPKRLSLQSGGEVDLKQTTPPPQGEVDLK